MAWKGVLLLCASAVCAKDFSQANAVNDQIAETFDHMDFGLNSRSIQQLISAAVLIVTISLVVAVSFCLFRLFMLYCRNYRNTVAYQLPAHQVSLGRRCKSEVTDSQRPLYSFRAVFSDSLDNLNV